MILILRQTLVIISHIIHQCPNILVISKEFLLNFRIRSIGDYKMRFVHWIIHKNPTILFRQITFLSLTIIVSNFRLLQANYDNI